MLSAIANATNYAQNYQNLPQDNELEKLWNTTKNWDFSVSKKQKFLCQEALEHVLAVWIFNIRIFHMLFLLSKLGLYMWILAYFLGKIDVFLKVPHLLWAWNFVNVYLTHFRIRILRGSFQIYLKKWFFWPPKHCNSPWVDWKKKFSLTLNVMISQMARNECLRFNVYVKIQVNYKILWLETPKEVFVLHQPPSYQEVMFWGNFDKKTFVL
jgi:hypothetical protein